MSTWHIIAKWRIRAIGRGRVRQDFFFMTMFKMVSLFQGYAGLFPARVILFLSLQERKLDSRM